MRVANTPELDQIEKTTTVRTVNTCILKWTSAALLMSILAGCGGGGSGGGGAGGGGGAPPPPPKFTIGGTVTGLQGSLVLRNNGQDDLTVTADGPFTLATSIETGRPYFVTIQTQPATQVCVLANGSGTIDGANVANVTVTCGAVQTTQLHVDANVGSADLSWSSPHDATSNVYVSSAPHCDIQNFSACPDGTVHANVTSPLIVEELRNGQAYYFQVDATLSDGTHQLSNEASTRPNVMAFNGDVNAIAVGQDGTQYLGGSFTAIGITSGGAVPFGAASSQPAIPDFPMVMGTVLATVSDGVGGWYIGGLFTQVGGQARKNLAHIFANGTVDPNFAQDFDQPIRALAFSANTLYVGGEFSNIGIQQRNRLAAFDTNGILLKWNPDASGGAVFALAVAGDVVYAGGSFTGISIVGSNHLAAIKSDGTLLPWQPNVLGTVLALEVSGDTVYVGGAFPGIDNKTRHNLAAISSISATSTAAQVLPWNPDADESVSALAVAGNTVYVGGSFHTVAGAARNHLAAVDATGAGSLINWHPDADNVVFALKVAGSTIYAGGFFDAVDGIERRNLAAIGADGVVSAWNPAPNNAVEALAIAGDTVFAGGQFTGIASAPRNSLAAIDVHGRLTAWNPDADDSAVLALAVAGNTVYAGGSFTQIANQTRNHLAAIGTDGALLDWSPGAEDGTVSALAVSGSTVYAGGSFTRVATTVQGSQARGSLVAIDTNGTILGWNPSVNNTVNTLLVSGGTVYVGGLFNQVTTPGGTKTRNHLVAIGTDGVLSTWDPNADGEVRAMAIIGDTLYAGGSFATIGGLARTNFAAIGTNGMLSPWQANANGFVTALAASGNTLYAGGPFTNITANGGGKPRQGLAALNVDGDLLNWNPNAGEGVNVLAVSGETVYAGGLFTTLGGLPRFFFGAIDAGGIGAVVP